MIILASTSPRRKQLLGLITKDFICVSPTINEEDYLPNNIYETPKILAHYKAHSIKYSDNDCVISSDTIVIFNNKIYGKAKDKNEASKMLHELSNNKHLVITNFTILYKNQEISKDVITEVYFNNLSEELISSYLDSNLWVGKAGSYGIQDSKYKLVKEIKGDYYNVVGLPIEELKKELKNLKVL